MILYSAGEQTAEISIQIKLCCFLHLHYKSVLKVYKLPLQLVEKYIGTLTFY